MPIEWQGDHKLLGDEKSSFERELKRIGLDPATFLVEVRHEHDAEDLGGRDAKRYTVYISDTAHPEHETCKLSGGQGKDWIGRYVQIQMRHR